MQCGWILSGTHIWLNSWFFESIREELLSPRRRLWLNTGMRCLFSGSCAAIWYMQSRADSKVMDWTSISENRPLRWLLVAFLTIFVEFVHTDLVPLEAEALAGCAAAASPVAAFEAPLLLPNAVSRLQLKS